MAKRERCVTEQTRVDTEALTRLQSPGAVFFTTTRSRRRVSMTTWRCAA